MAKKKSTKKSADKGAARRTPGDGSKGAKLIASVVVILIILVGGYFIFGGDSDYTNEELDSFAKCLTEEGAVMYGAFWCPHCARSKANFGSSFQYINYIECDPRGENEQSELCIEKEIKGYDTWEFKDGSRIETGEPSFEELSIKTGCPLPA